MLLYIGNEYDYLLKEIRNNDENFNYNILKKYDIRECINQILSPDFNAAIIELSSLENTIDDIVSTFNQIKKMNPLFKIAFIGIGYNVKSRIIMALKEVGYNDFFIAGSDDFFFSALKDYIADFEEKTSVNIKFTEQNFNSLYNSALEESREKITKFSEVNIGIIGASRKIGTTTQCMQLIKYLHSKNRSACYREMNDNRYVDALEQFFDDVSKDGTVRNYQNINLYDKLKDIDLIRKANYDYCITDYGSIKDCKIIPSFLQSDIKIVVTGFKANEIDDFKGILKHFYNYDNIYYIFNFIPEKDRKQIKMVMEEKGSMTYFADFSPDPFIYSGNNKFYQDIVKNIERRKKEFSSQNTKEKKNTLLRKWQKCI